MLVTGKCHRYVESPSGNTGPFWVPAEFMVPARQLACEGHGTKATLVRSLPRVRPHVVHKGCFLCEGLGTQVALKRPLASVYAEVSIQVAPRCEGLAAVAANVQLDVHIFRGAQVAPTIFREREILPHLSDRQVVYMLLGTVLPSGDTCKMDNAI